MGKKKGSSGGSKKKKDGGGTSSNASKWRPVGEASGSKQGEVAAELPGAVGGVIEGSFIPPGCDASAAKEEEVVAYACYEDNLAKGFWTPPRLKGRNESLIEAVNDWHFAMLNDLHRNQFYWDACESVVKGKQVVDIGSGSGLLSMIAAKQGASQVLAIEASRDMVHLAQLNLKKNGFNNIRVIHNLSNNVRLEESEKADVIVSETLGVLMLGEGMLDYISDARKRLAKPNCVVIPAGGAQFVQLISSPSLTMVSSVHPECCKGLDLSAIGSLQDTGNLFFTKQWGFRLNSLADVKPMSARVEILEVDFTSTERHHIPATKTFRLEALSDGVIHAVVASWEVWNDKERTHKMTTHPEDTKDAHWGFARDMQWGQGLQLIEDFDEAKKSDRNSAPAPFHVTKGEVLLLTARFSVPCRQTFQFTLRRAAAVSSSSVAALEVLPSVAAPEVIPGVAAPETTESLPTV